jgi:hypothetical protein
MPGDEAHGGFGELHALHIMVDNLRHIIYYTDQLI